MSFRRDVPQSRTHFRSTLTIPNQETSIYIADRMVAVNWTEFKGHGQQLKASFDWKSSALSSVYQEEVLCHTDLVCVNLIVVNFLKAVLDNSRGNTIVWQQCESLAWKFKDLWCG